MNLETVGSASGFFAQMIAAEAEDLPSLAQDAFAQLGFQHTVIAHIGHRFGVIDPRPIAGTTMLEDWMTVYRREGYVRHDVLSRAALWAAEPFTLTEVENRFKGPKATRFLNDVRKYCGEELLLCPSLGVDGAILAVVLSMDRRRTMSAAERQAAHSLACLYAGLIQRGSGQAWNWDPEESGPISKRELECIYWVFQGKTDMELAEILSISVSTAHHHVERAKSKFKARSRVDLALRAVRLGMVIEPSSL